MDKKQTTSQLNDFLKRVESARVVITKEDQQMISDIMKVIAPDSLRKATTNIEMLSKALSEDSTSPDQHRYIMVDDDYLLATDGYRVAMIENTDDLDVGVYTKNMQKVKHQGEINLKQYNKQFLIDYIHEMNVRSTDCEVKVVTGSDGVGQFRVLDVKGKLMFHVDHFVQFMNGEDEIIVKYNDEKISGYCEIINPKFPDVTLIIGNIVV